MMKRFAFAFSTMALLAACAVEPEPAVPQPDPALVERLALANDSAAEAPRLDKADRIVASVGRKEPDRLAGAAETLLAR